MSAKIPLQLDTYTLPPIKVVTGLPEPERQWWQPLTSTLIHGPTSAVLVDPPITVDQSKQLITWIESIFALYPHNSKTLTHIFITYAHGDHFFGAPMLRARWPAAQIVATATVSEGVVATYTPAVYGLWKSWFPDDDQLPEQQVVPSALPASNEFTLDGETLRVYDASSDCEKSSFLHVPSIGAVVAGDIVYGDCHQHLGEAHTAAARQLWLDALALIDSLDPHVVVASHKRASQSDGRHLVAATRQYILDFARWGQEVREDASVTAADKAGALFARVKSGYPHRWNDWLLLEGAAAFFK